MADIVDIHKFFEANLPGYQRKDSLTCIRFFLEQARLPYKKPIKSFLANFPYLKHFVTEMWQGVEISENRPHNKPQKKPDGFGKCSCGGRYIKRQNRADRSFFLGCTRYPKCRNTKPYLL